MQQYFVEQAETYDEACRKVREKYGDRATIVLRKTVLLRTGPFGLFPREGVEVSGPIPQASQDAPRKTEAREPGKEHLDFQEEKRKVLAAANRGDPLLQQVLSEVRTIKERMEHPGAAADEHPSLRQIDENLLINDFPPSYRVGILERMKREFSLETLDNYDEVQDKVLEWIGESISIYREEQFHRLPRIMALVGPTGVGKTTTIAKLAANFGIDSHGRRVRQIVLITIDAFRIGAKQQLESYGKILEFPCFAVEDYEELKKTIAMNSDGTDIILIDTIGKSPRDMVKLGEMKQLLDACGSFAEVHLALSAATKSSDIKEILQQFEPFNYRSVIITKLDETIRAGNVIGALAEKEKPMSYITNGQKVPTDIRKASAVQLLINLEGFRVNRVKLEEKFPGKEPEQMGLWR
ncbi:MAG: flagellar biosynthesis protein FlhF [Treponema sp.]|jgi:flagellar biosynthesis protein FlhF|nr:flagellar biosynthesis protein FlhF [Treponema sp.]